MKKENINFKRLMTILIATTMCMTTLAIVPTVSADIPTGMVSYWKLDDGSGTIAIDSFGSNDGTLINGPIWTTGQVNGALDFDGVDDYVEVNCESGSSLNLDNAVTIEAWVKSPSAGSYYEYVIAKYLDGGKASYALDTCSASYTARFYVTTNGAYHQVTTTTSDYDIWDGEWHHLVGSYDKDGGTDNLNLYIDGTLYSSGTTTDVIDINVNMNLYIGSYGTGYNFPGLIDEVAVYNTALSASEISSQYYAGLAGYGYCDCPDTVHVDDDYTQGSCDEHNWHWDAFATIQEGVDAVCDGGTVTVYDGTYFEHVQIKNPLTLQAGSTPIIDGGGSGVGIDLASSDVTIQGMTIMNCNSGIQGYLVSAEYTISPGYQNIHLVDNTIYNMNNGVWGFGIYLGTESERYNSVDPLGIYDPWLVSNGLLDFTGLEINGNEIYDTSGACVTLQSMYPATGTIDVYDNYIHDADASCIWIDSSEDLLIEENTLETCSTGIFISAYSDGWYEGTPNQPFDSKNIDIIGNDISANSYGVRVYDGWPSLININYNNIVGNTGLGVYNYLSENVDATCNWWGDASGPSGVGPGTGDAVSVNVDYCPWLSIVEYGDVSLSGGSQAEHFDNIWDLTKGDIEIQFTYDANGLVDDAGCHAWAELGIREVGYGDFNPTWDVEGAGVWLATDYEWSVNTFDPDPLGAPTLDLDDKLILQKAGGHGEGDYNLPSTPPAPGNNHRVWWDRDGVDPWQNDETANTEGIYNIVIELHATSDITGEAKMKINGLYQGFETDGNWNTIELTPAGMTFTGDMTQMQVFYGIYGYGATHSVSFKDITIKRYYTTVIDTLTVTPDLVPINDAVALTATFTSPCGSPHTATIDWGDGTTEAGNVGSGTVTGGYTYTDTGVYTVTLSVKDSASQTYVKEFQYVVVYDPSDGFVTGGGWINSPAGAYVSDPDAEGKANFGFVSKYKKGQSTPTGNTEFKFEMANLDFHSNNYDWLVITGGDKAIYKGTGTINDLGSYKFMITAYDDSTDTFRIKIWEEDEFGDETIIYDNGANTPLGGGQIKIHKN